MTQFKHVTNWVKHGRTLLHESVLQLLSDDELSTDDVNNINSQVYRLLQKGVNVHALNDDNETPMHVAARSQWPGGRLVINLLVDYGADIEALNMHGATVLSIASGEGSHEAVGYLIREGAQLDVQTSSEGDTPLHRAIRNGKVHSMIALMKAGADKTVVNHERYTARTIPCSDKTSNAFKAVMQENENSLSIRFKRHDDNESSRKRVNDSPHVITSNARKPTNSRRSMFEKIEEWISDGGGLLLDSVATLVRRNQFKGRSEQVYAVVDLLMRRKVDVETPNQDGATALHVAARCKEDQDVVALLVENGANLEARNNVYGGTPLMNACREGTTKTVLYLIDRGAEIDARADNGQTALHQAVCRGDHKDEAMMRILIRHGAKTDTRDENKDSAATTKCHPDMRKAFNEAVQERERLISTSIPE